MKKQILTIAAILFCAVSFSQTSNNAFNGISLYKVTKVVSAVYNEETNGWDEDEPTYPSAMRIVSQGNLIVVTDEAKSNYRIKKILNEDEDSYSFLATDEKERDMGILLTRDKIIVLYANQYYIKYFVSKSPASSN